MKILCLTAWKANDLAFVILWEVMKYLFRYKYEDIKTLPETLLLTVLQHFVSLLPEWKETDHYLIVPNGRYGYWNTSSPCRCNDVRCRVLNN